MASPDLTAQNGCGLRLQKVQQGRVAQQVTVDFSAGQPYNAESAENIRDIIFEERQSYPAAELRIYGYDDFIVWQGVDFDPAQEPADFDILTLAWVPTV